MYFNTSFWFIINGRTISDIHHAPKYLGINNTRYKDYLKSGENIDLIISNNTFLSVPVINSGKDKFIYFDISGTITTPINIKVNDSTTQITLNKNNNYVAEIRSVQEGDVKSANQVLLKYIKPVKKTSSTSGKKAIKKPTEEIDDVLQCTEYEDLDTLLGCVHCTTQEGFVCVNSSGAHASCTPICNDTIVSGSE